MGSPLYFIHKYRTMSARQKFSVAAEKALNDQVNAELSASYVYRSMAGFFDRDDVALHGFRDFFKKAAEEETEHAQMFIDYINKRGGRVTLKAIGAPKQEWATALEALEDALTLDNDAQMTDFIEGNFLGEQVDAIKELADMITNVKRVGTEGLGIYLFDKYLKA